MGGNTSKHQALKTGMSNHHIQVHPAVVPVSQWVSSSMDATSPVEKMRETTVQRIIPEFDRIPMNQLHKETLKLPVRSQNSSYDFNFSPKAEKLEVLSKEAFYPRSASSKIPVPKSSAVDTQNPNYKMVREKSKVISHGAGDLDSNENYVDKMLRQKSKVVNHVAVGKLVSNENPVNIQKLNDKMLRQKSNVVNHDQGDQNINDNYKMDSLNLKDTKMLRKKSKEVNPVVQDLNKNYVVRRIEDVQTKTVASKPPYSVTQNSSSTGSTATSDSDPKKKKLVIRGLKRFCESRGSSCPPTWVKDFPCKSKFHPDNYVYDWDEGPNAVKRNTPLMNKCRKQGGRCGTCGIYAVDVCRACRKCELDCACPKLPKIPEFVSQMFGGGATWPQSQSDNAPRDFAGEEQSRQYSNGPPANYNNPYYSQIPVPPPCYSPYPYYSPVQYAVPSMYPGCYPPPSTYMPMPMIPAQPSIPNYYSPGPNYQTSPELNYQTNQATPELTYNGQPTNPQTSFNMSFYQ